MSPQIKNLLTAFLLMALAGSAFIAGFFTNDFIELRSGSGTLVRERQPFDLFWEAWERISENFIGELPDDTAFTYGAIRGVVGLLDDPYTVFIEPAIRDQERDTLRGTFGGIGAYLRRPDEGGDILIEPIPGNPAEMAGILFGDVLVAVDGVAVTPEMTVEDVVNMIRGEKGTAVTLTVIHPGSTDPVEIDVERDDILIPSVSYRLLDAERPIGYVQLSRFSGESGNEIHAALTALLADGAEAFVLDLRQNGGGLLDAAVSVADHFLRGGPVVIQQSRTSGETVLEATTETLVPDLPLVVLIDGGTASASEILAGALRDRGRATLIGQKSFGKGSVQLVFDLSDGSSVHVTSARWLTPDRSAIDQLGLEPDIPVTITQEAIDNGRDETLERAVDFLLE
ncbi:MAG: S41 family peptidase [Anaerolineales bacterium]|nr:S41 family peptidase [Anaerolineales bacterium]